MSKIEGYIELKGSMILEGPFLEQVMAAYLLSKGKKVVPRLETGGIQHDILVETYEGFIVYECTGQREIREDKIDKFHSDVLYLHSVLTKLEGKGIIEAVFVAAVNDDAWDPSAKVALNSVEKSFKKRIGAKLSVISGINLIKELIGSGVLGLRLAKGKLHFAGPQDYAIRYIPDRKEFQMSFAPLSPTEMLSFRELPHSFLPSYYWESYYKDLYLESSEGKKEPLTIWTYYIEEGTTWRDVKDMVEAYYSMLSLRKRTYIMERGDDYLIEEYKSRRGNYYYTVHMFSVDTRFDSSVAGRLMGKAIRIMDNIKEKYKDMLEKEPFSIYLHSATEDWSTKAWSKVKGRIPRSLISDISAIIVERGNDFLLKLLNAGILGLRFRVRNEVTLVGPGIDAVRLSNTDSGWGITISKSPLYY